MEVKSVRTFLVILIKVATPPLPLQTKFIWSKIGSNECFFWPQHCWCVCGVCLLEGGGGGGGLKRWDEPKADKKNAVRSGVLCNNYLERRFFLVPSSFVLHCRINILRTWNREKTPFQVIVT